MRRIYFLSPTIATTHKIVEELQADGIEERHIHILAKRDTPLEGLPEAGVSIKTDFLAAAERGVALGGVTGLLAGLVGLRFAGFAIAGGPLLGIIIAGATIGSLMGGLAGMSAGNSRLEKYQEAIEQGELLVLVDVLPERIDALRELVVRHHPEVEFGGIEDIFPPSY